MIPFAAFLTPTVLRLGSIVLVLGISFAGGWWVNGNRWEVKYQKLDAQYQTFSAGVARLGEEAKAKNATIALNDLKAKERADEQNRRRHTANINTIIRLRNEADRARSRELPPAPAGSSRPDLICLDRAEYSRANGEALSRLREGARRLADEGTAATVGLDTAKQWKKDIDQGDTK